MRHEPIAIVCEHPMEAAFVNEKGVLICRWCKELWALNWELKKARKRLAELGKGCWRKLPCKRHIEKFNLECPECNSKNAEWVDVQ